MSYFWEMFLHFVFFRHLLSLFSFRSSYCDVASHPDLLVFFFLLSYFLFLPFCSTSCISSTFNVSTERLILAPFSILLFSDCSFFYSILFLFHGCSIFSYVSENTASVESFLFPILFPFFFQVLSFVFFVFIFYCCRYPQMPSNLWLSVFHYFKRLKVMYEWAGLVNFGFHCNIFMGGVGRARNKLSCQIL